MDQNSKLDRRQFLNKIAVTCAAVTGAGIVLSACKGSNAEGGGATGQGGAAAPAATDCSDLSALSEADKKSRTGLQYVEVSAKPNQNCANCKLFQEKAPCNGCSVVKGPIAAGGWCAAWAAKG